MAQRARRAVVARQYLEQVVGRDADRLLQRLVHRPAQGFQAVGAGPECVYLYQWHAYILVGTEPLPPPPVTGWAHE
ncbi:hypothetical protein GCM10010218_22750 [Streptomyces mashuensis]|uniref:Uncharacterized protein n=1 Tax=Streptomyces mashuensis TaxID=33904 RepID=A0A919B199_9ACTN|nr:hypothetical protein GCM10010218_22750 [Streptomyces mashuensis]